jgi:HK97 family phage major capsid protein
MENQTFDNVDKDLANALTTQPASTGDVLIPEKISAGIRRYVETESPLYSLTPQIPWKTKFYEYRKLIDLPTAQAVKEGEIAPTSHSKFDKDIAEMKWITSTGEVTGPEIDSTQELIDIWAEEVNNHSLAMVNEIERLIIAGDAEANPLEFDGLLQQIPASNNGIDGGGAALTLSMLDAAGDAPKKGTPKHALMGKAHSRRLWSLLQAQQRFVDRKDVEGGFTVPMYGDKQIVRLGDEAAAAVGDNVLFPDFDHIKLAVLRPLTFEKLAKVEDSERFYIRMYAVLAVEGQNIYHARLNNVLSAPGTP